MSLRRKVSHFLALLVVAALAVGLMAGPAVARPAGKQKMSAKQRAQVRAKLRKQIRKNPKAITRKSFLRKAALVNFRLPITVRLRTGDRPATPTDESATLNSNKATIDLGASLGQREIDLGGSLAGEIVFKDSFDGGALGNVDLDLRPGPKGLTSTSIPLLWNTQVSGAGTRWDANALAGADPALAGLEALAGCSNFTGTSPLTFGAGYLNAGAGYPGFPYYTTLANVPSTAQGFLPQTPGEDSIDKLVSNKTPGLNNVLGGSPNPFPSGFGPTGATAPNVRDAVLRTSALTLNIADPGTQVTGFVPNNGSNNNQSNAANPPVQNSQNIVIGRSGGQANLFGNIPGKSYGIDVTVSLATKINSIFRIVDQDTTGGPLITGGNWPAGVFACRQVYSGAVQNYIPGVRLQGNLKIAPAITSDGRLRIAKATISSGGQEKAYVALAACLVPYASYTVPQLSSDTADTGIPGAQSGNPPGIPFAGYDQLPSDVFSQRATPVSANCNDQPTELVRDSGLTRNSVNPLQNAQTTNGYTVAQDGSKAVVSGLLTVDNVSADVLIGDTP